MNLSNKQLRVLVDNIYTKHFEPAYEKEQADFEKQKASLKLTKQEEIIVKRYVEATKQYKVLIKGRYCIPTITETTENVIRSKERSLNFISKTPTKQQIEQAVILATIDSKDINEIMKIVIKNLKLD